MKKPLKFTKKLKKIFIIVMKSNIVIRCIRIHNHQALYSQETPYPLKQLIKILEKLNYPLMKNYEEMSKKKVWVRETNEHSLFLLLKHNNIKLKGIIRTNDEIQMILRKTMKIKALFKISKKKCTFNFNFIKYPLLRWTYRNEPYLDKTMIKCFLLEKDENW